MSHTIYQIHFTNENGKREYFPGNFYSQDRAKEAIAKLIDKGFKDAAYVGFKFNIGPR